MADAAAKSTRKHGLRLPARVPPSTPMRTSRAGDQHVCLAGSRADSLVAVAPRRRAPPARGSVPGPIGRSGPPPSCSQSGGPGAPPAAAAPLASLQGLLHLFSIMCNAALLVCDPPRPRQCRPDRSLQPPRVSSGGYPSRGTILSIAQIRPACCCSVADQACMLLLGWPCPGGRLTAVGGAKAVGPGLGHGFGGGRARRARRRMCRPWWGAA